MKTMIEVEETTEQKPNLEDETFEAWKSSIGGFGKDYEIKIERVEPKPEAGHLDEYEDFADIDEAFLKSRYGGGKYKIKVFERNEKGLKKFKSQRTVKIAGEPKVRASVSDGENVALGLLERQLDEAKRRQEKLEEEIKQPRNEPFYDLMRQQLVASQDRAMRLEERLIELQTRPKDDNGTTRILELLAAGKGQELQAVAERHRSEMEAMRHNYESQLARVEDRSKTALESTREDTKRQIDLLTRTYDMRISSMESAYGNQITLLQTQLENARAEERRLRADLDKIRSEKNKTPAEMVGEIVQLKQLVEELGPSQEEESTVEKVFNKISENPLIQGISHRLMTAQPQPMPQQLPPTPPPAQAKQKAEPETSPEQLEILQALKYTELAITNNVDPAIFARSLSNQVPSELVDELIRNGADPFVDAIKQSIPKSVIVTNRGRTFLREVVKYLTAPEDSATTS